VPAVKWIEVVEYTDPSCSWAWGTEPKYRRLGWQYGDHIRSWRRVMCGIIAAGWAEPYGYEPHAEAARAAYEAYLVPVSELTGMPRPVPVHYAMTQSEDACRVAKAAEFHGEPIASAVLRRLRESWFVHGRPADTLHRGLAAVTGVVGLDIDRLARDLADPATEAAFRADWEEARNPDEYVRNLPDTRPGRGAAQPHNGRMRYGLPCLILTGPAGAVTVSGWCDWDRWESAVQSVCPHASARPRPTPAEAFAQWPTLARAELDELCGPGAPPPDDVVEYRRPGALLWLTQHEAAAWSVLT
jgi:predicted DsbA family dithiol-disulfide isomerase